MIGVQMVLLKVALDNRPSAGARDGVEHVPFSNADNDAGLSRPYQFWQWKSAKPYVTAHLARSRRKILCGRLANTKRAGRYWMSLAYFIAALSFIQLFLSPIARSEFYINSLGYTGLAVEATLPLPQIVANHRTHSCKGFRVSVLAAWILGDMMKLSYFFFSVEVIPWAFRLCAMFQCVCDLYLGVQFWMYTRPASLETASSSVELGEKDLRMT